MGEHVTIKPELRDRLEKLASNTDRSGDDLANEAVERYLDYQEWAIAEVNKGIAAADRGELVSDEAVQDWLCSLGTEDELPLPQSSTV